MPPAVRARIARVGAAVVVTGVVGAVLVLASSATAVDVAGIALLGIALVVAVAAVFYEIGASEDRDRAASARDRDPGAP
jgi:hypothetical protein